MNYPLISEYIEAIKSAEDNFEELTNLRAVLGDDGQPVMTSGNFAVVFKMKEEETGKLYALKCFTKEQQGREEAYHQIAEELKDVDSPYLVSLRYLEKELFVDTEQTDETEFPVLLMDWVEGKTLDKYLRENLDDKYALEMLAYRFSQLAQWLIPQPFAHGDLKPDNILVREDGTLVLVDYDGMYVPAMKGQRARELGSPDFRHPQRTEDDFDEHIDDFPIVSILLSLKAISINPQLLEDYGAADRLLFSAIDYRILSESQVLDVLKIMLHDNELATLLPIFIFCVTHNKLSQGSINLLNLNRPQIQEHEIPNTFVTDEDLTDVWIDEFGAKYSKDRKRLLKGVNVVKYSILDGTEIICDNAFENCTELINIHIPESVKSIGSCAFSDCINLQSVFLPDGITSIDWYSFSGCASLESICLPNGLKSLQGNAFAGCISLVAINLPDGLEFIGQGCFNCCHSLKSINLPQSLNYIECNVFGACSNLCHVHLPDNLLSIDEGLFYDCINLKSIVIPSTVESIGIIAFSNCINLKIIHFLGKVDYINKDAFNNCFSLSLVSVPSGSKVKYQNFFPQEMISETLQQVDNPIISTSQLDLNDVWIDFYGAKYSKDGCCLLNVPNNLPFYTIKNGTIMVAEWAFSGCNSLSVVSIPNTVKYIGAYAFEGCQLKNLNVPDSVSFIGDYAFSYNPLQQVNLPGSLTYIRAKAFFGCKNISKIQIPPKYKENFEIMLPEYKDKFVDYYQTTEL